MAFNPVTNGGDDENFTDAGKLISKWTREPESIPRSNKDRLDALKQTNLNIPEYVKSIQVIPEVPGTLTIKLPPVEMLDQAQDEANNIIATGGVYELLDEYKKQSDQSAGKMAPMDFFHMRLGEYSLSRCR